MIDKYKKVCYYKGMDEQAITSPSTIDIIKKAGLTESQARGYLALIEHGTLTPAELADHTGETRTNAYMICDKLEKLGLASKKDSKKAEYTPSHPDNLKKLVIASQRRLKQANEGLSGIIPALNTKFHLNNDAASILTLEGVDGIKTLYDDIVRQGHHLSIIASSHDRIDSDIGAMIDQQIKRQVEIGIESRALYRVTSTEIASLRNHDIHARDSGFDVPAQIIIYGHTVAISTFQQGMVTTVINHPEITSTFQTIFDTLWEKSATT
ncbi:MAG: helix-turn-helix domain-containing protein [Candidatus Saccharimonadales bacterium]